MQPSRRSQRLKVILIAALFFGPLLLAFYFYYGHGLEQLRPSTQRGHLLSPIQVLPATWGDQTAPWANRHWTLLLAGSDPLDAKGQGLLNDLIKVRLATEKDKDRVVVALLQSNKSSLPSDLNSVQLVLDDAALSHLGAILAVDSGPVLGSNRVFLVDPNGNLVMWYESGQNLLDVLNDLLKLLKLSHIG